MHTYQQTKFPPKLQLTVTNMNFWITPNRNSNLNPTWSFSSFLAHPGYQGNFCFPGLSLAHQSMTKMHWEWTNALFIVHEGEHASPEIQCALYLPDAATNIYQHYFSPLVPFIKLQPLCSEEGGGRENKGYRWPAVLGCFCTFNHG